MRCPNCGRVFTAGESICPDDGATLEPPVADPLVGMVLGGSYRVGPMIAAGGMSRVYEATHVRLGRRLVVKVLLESHAFNREVLERAEREARAMSAIESENVVEVIDVLRTADGRPCMVVDFLEGEDLGSRLERVGTLPPAEAVGIVRQICNGVGAAHMAGVIHRDLKPSNVFLVARPEGEVVKLLDFGVAKQEGSEQLTETGALVGTPAYMAPEQAMGAEAVDGRADVYAVGAILYHMLTGSPPYGREDATATLMQLLKGDPPRARSIDNTVPEELEAVIERAMARDPEQRTPSARQLAQDLLPYDRQVVRQGAGASWIESLSQRRSADKKATWARAIVLGLVLAATVLATAWALAFTGAVVLSVVRQAALTDLYRAIILVVPAVIGITSAILAIRSAVRRWRSLPKVERLGTALARALGSGLCVTALGELVILARDALAFTGNVPALPVHAAVLGAGGAVALVVFLVSK